MYVLDNLERITFASDLRKLFASLWPLHRSITGHGYRESLKLIEEWMPLKSLPTPTGTEVFDWVVPEEWHVKEAYFVGPNGKKYADVHKNNLHLLGYSRSFRGKVSLTELKAHLFTRPDLPNAIPYVTSYYKERWGFCLSHAEWLELPEGEYEVVIDTSFGPGEIIVGEATLPGRSQRSLLFTSYLCHPSMANNELSGPLTLVCLYRLLKEKWADDLPFTIKFVLHPETIGALCYLHHTKDTIRDEVVGGCVISCVGMDTPLHFKEARKPGSDFERALSLCVRESNGTTGAFTPFGSDERQYGSPGFNLPVGLLSRGDFTFPEYHTSLDDENAIDFENIVQTAEAIFQALRLVDQNEILENSVMFGEPFLSKYGLYPTTSTGNAIGLGLSSLEEAYIWILSASDGTRDVISVAQESGLRSEASLAATRNLKTAGLLRVRQA